MDKITILSETPGVQDGEIEDTSTSPPSKEPVSAVSNKSQSGQPPATELFEQILLRN